MDPTGTSPGSKSGTASQPSLDYPVWLPELQRMLMVSGDLEDFLLRVTTLSAAAMPAGISCMIAVELPGRPPIVAGSDEGALAVGKVDCTHREGPSLEVRHTSRPVYVPDLTRERRRWASALEALAHGIRSWLAIPIQGPSGVVGVLSLYAAWADAFDEATRERMRTFTDDIAGVITLAIQLADQIQLNDDLRSALESRSVIDQAIGVIMAENRCDRDAAFGILRNASQNRHTKLREVAADLVQSVTGHRPTPGPFCPRQ
jgi:GAF domain-containing protein